MPFRNARPLLLGLRPQVGRSLKVLPIADQLKSVVGIAGAKGTQG